MNITKKYLLENVRNFCKTFCNHPSTGMKCFVNCPHYATKQYLADRSQQLSLLTLKGFLEECEKILTDYPPIFCGEMWHSQIRWSIDKIMKSNGDAPMTDKWWSHLHIVLKKTGWHKDHSRVRRHPDPNNRGDDYMYVKTGGKNV